MAIESGIKELLPEIIGWRHEFHKFPETGYDVPRTAGRIAGLLREFGCDEVVEGIGRSGVVATIHGQQTQSGRAIGLRADMDGLPIEEKTGLVHASRVAGKPTT